MARRCRDIVLPSLRKLHEQATARGVDVAFLAFLRPDAAVLDADERDFFENDLRQRRGRWSASLASYSRLVDAYNRELERLSTEIGAGFLPIHAGFRAGAGEFQDICHLTEKGIERKVELVFEHLRAYLEQRHPEALPAR